MSKLPPVPDYIAAHAREYLIRDKGAMAEMLFNEDLEELRLYRQTLEAFIESEERKEVEHLSKLAKQNDGEFWFNHYPYQWQDIIGSQLRKSFVVSLLSLAEFHLGLLCRDVAQLTDARITYEDLKGSIFVRAKKYLETFGSFGFPHQSEWEIVSDFYALRNSIVHNSALVDSDRNSKRIMSLQKKAPGISVPSAGLLELKSEFGSFALETVAKFLGNLHQEYISLCSRLEKEEHG